MYSLMIWLIHLFRDSKNTKDFQYISDIHTIKHKRNCKHQTWHGNLYSDSLLKSSILHVFLVSYFIHILPLCAGHPCLQNPEMHCYLLEENERLSNSKLQFLFLKRIIDNASMISYFNKGLPLRIWLVYVYSINSHVKSFVALRKHHINLSYYKSLKRHFMTSKLMIIK